MDKIFCTECNTANGMEVHEILNGICYCSCTNNNCGKIIEVKEFSEVTIDNKKYLYSAIFNAYYRRCNITKRYFFEKGYTKTGTIKKSESIIYYDDCKYDYLDKNVA